MHIPITDDLLFIMILILIGIIVGYSAGLFGFGGGIVLVPTLLTLFPFFGATHQVVMHNAIGTALAVIVPTALMSTYKHYRLHHIDFDFAKRYLAFALLGAIIGSVSMHVVPAFYLKLIFTIYLFVATLFVALRAAGGRDITQYPNTPVVYLGSTFFGGISVWLGMGGGTFTVPFLRVFRYPYHRCIGISAAGGLIIGFVGAIGAIIHGVGVPGRSSYSFGFVNVLAFLIISPITMYLSPKGAAKAATLSETTIKWLYCSILLIIACYMTFMTFFH